MNRSTLNLLTILGPVCALAVFGPAAAGADPAATTAAMISPTSSGTATVASSTEAWAPLRAFIGSWSGVQSAAPGAADTKAAKLTRKFETGLNSKHLEVADRSNGSDWALAGVISFDAEHGGLVLRKFAADGKVNDLAIDPAASNATHLVFAGVGENAGRTRVTYDRSGWNDFVERVEIAPEGKDFSVVSETKFKRKG